jgi:hypothetical protein
MAKIENKPGIHVPGYVSRIIDSKVPIVSVGYIGLKADSYAMEVDAQSLLHADKKEPNLVQIAIAPNTRLMGCPDPTTPGLNLEVDGKLTVHTTAPLRQDLYQAVAENKQAQSLWQSIKEPLLAPLAGLVMAVESTGYGAMLPALAAVVGRIPWGRAVDLSLAQFVGAECKALNLGEKTTLQTKVRLGNASVSPAFSIALPDRASLLPLAKSFDETILLLAHSLLSSETVRLANLVDFTKSNLQLNCDIDGLQMNFSDDSLGATVIPKNLRIDIGTQGEAGWPGIQVSHRVGVAKGTDAEPQHFFTARASLQHAPGELKANPMPPAPELGRAPTKLRPRTAYLSHLLRYMLVHSGAKGELTLTDKGWTKLTDVVPDLPLPGPLQSLEFCLKGQRIGLNHETLKSLPDAEVHLVRRWLRWAIRTVNLWIDWLIGRTPVPPVESVAFKFDNVVPVRLSNLGLGLPEAYRLAKLETFIAKALQGKLQRVSLAPDGKSMIIHCRFHLLGVRVPLLHSFSLPLPDVGDHPSIAAFDQLLSQQVLDGMDNPTLSMLMGMVGLASTNYHVLIPADAQMPLGKGQLLRSEGASVDVNPRGVKLSHDARFVDKATREEHGVRLDASVSFESKEPKA